MMRCEDGTLISGSTAMQESQSSPARLLLTAREAAQVLCLLARKL